MNGEPVFLDSNVCVYLIGEDSQRKHKAEDLLAMPSTVISSQADCQTLYSEDLQHGQVIEGKLTIINPFLKVSK